MPLPVPEATLCTSFSHIFIPHSLLLKPQDLLWLGVSTIAVNGIGWGREESILLMLFIFVDGPAFKFSLPEPLGGLSKTESVVNRFMFPKQEKISLYS